MDNLFEKLKIREIVLIYIGAVILTLAILQIPFVKSTYLNDKYFSEIILNILIFAWFYFMFSKENVSVKSKVINSLKKVRYSKILKLYLLNLGFYIGAGLIIFFGDEPLAKPPSGMFILLGITLAPIIEEFIFRGVIMNRLKIKFGIISAIFVNAIIFGIVHFDLNIFGRLFFGILSSILYIETKNIVNCIILHILNNASVFIFSIIYKYTNFSINVDSEFKTGMMVLIIFSCFVSSIAFNIIYIKNNLPRKNSELS